MPIEIKNLQALGPGRHTGIITSATIENRNFQKAGMAPKLEPTLVVMIQPKNTTDGVYNPQEVLFNPESVAPISGLGKLVKNLGFEIDYKAGGSFDEKELEGIEVSFESIIQPNNPKFTKVKNDSITLLK